MQLTAQELPLHLQELYTVVLFNKSGSPVARTFRLRALHFDLQTITHELYGYSTQQGKLRFVLHPRRQFIIWAGAQHPDVTLSVDSCIHHTKHGPVRRLKRWPAYDSRYMYRALDSVWADPVVSNIGDRPQGPGRLIDLCSEPTAVTTTPTPKQEDVNAERQ